MDHSHQRPLWELRGVTKTFPGVVANDNISLKLYRGEIHALLGENGCGKSTLIKIISGVQKPDSGVIVANGKEVTLESPIDARDEGVATVFQEFSLVPTLSVAENIYLGRYPKKGLFIDCQKMIKGAGEVLSRLGINIGPETLVANLSVAQQQLVEIAKAISTNATLLILDEPSTALGQDEIVVLHKLLKGMKSHGVSILYISHRLDEVLDLVDSMTVLKDGQSVWASKNEGVDVDLIVSKMIGSSVKEHYPKEKVEPGKTVLKVYNITTNTGVNDVSFEVREGEVLGLGGVIGCGRTEICKALFGLDKITSGRIEMFGKEVTIKSPVDAISNGLALVPENRKFDGLFFNFTGGPNITSASLGGTSYRGIMNFSNEKRATQKFINDLEISPRASDKLVGFLSGGNQQKLIIARWIFANSKVLILDEPTQGIDVGAKVAVYRLMNALVKEGRSIILISSDHNELLAMSDRIAIIKNGTIVDTRLAVEVGHADLVQSASGLQQKRQCA